MNDIAIDLLKIFGGAFAGFFGGRFLKSWEFSSADIKEAVDECCKLIRQIRETAILYWSRPRLPDDQLVERSILSDLHILETLRLHCAEEAPAFSDRDKVVCLIDDFSEQITSGDFQSSTRGSDSVRARKIRDAALRLELSFRVARRIERSALVPRWIRRRRLK